MDEKYSLPHGWMQRDLPKKDNEDYSEPVENSAITNINDSATILRFNPLVRDLRKEKDQHMLVSKVKEVLAKKKSRPPKGWMENTVNRIMQNNPNLQQNQAQAIAGDMWFNKLKPKTKTEIKKDYYGDKKSYVNKVMSKLGYTESEENTDLIHFFQNLLGHLNYLNIWYHTLHWDSSSQSYYSDHLLFQRLYEQILEEFDQVAEKALGISEDSTINRFVMGKYHIDKENEVQDMYKEGKTSCDVSVILEEQFLNILEEHPKDVSPGTQNLIDDLHDKHEENLYLLKQRKKEYNNQI